MLLNCHLFQPEAGSLDLTFSVFIVFFFFQAKDGIRNLAGAGVQTCALPICMIERRRRAGSFVARQPPHLEQVALEIPDIAMEVGSRGHLYGYRLLQRELRLAESSNARSEERRVGKECRSRWSPYH